ncbi:MAG: ATP-binding cassette domain-containing protein [Xanthomonadales bacterium]|nr:ABC transporter ATP-binding protein [Xanthomonadales bacterium]NIX12034.1 ATP-binding cassette domain-containing protein [Xanthomonadales bacterium]
MRSRSISRPVLSVEDLSVTFRSPRGPETAVDRVSFELREGEIAGLVGESGCGKSVTALALLNLVPRERAEVTGTIRLAGETLPPRDGPGWRRVRGGGIAMIFQEPGTALDPVFTIGHQLGRVIRRHRGAGASAARGLALEALEQGGFPQPDQVFRAYPHQLSGGMRQLVMIVMALVARPRVLIADEPTTALDVTTQALVLQRLRELRESTGTSILLVSHDLGVVATCCERALVMYCGRLVEEAPYDTLFHHARHPYTSGLLAAVPRIRRPGETGPVADPVPIPGQVPALDSLPRGCHFAERCAYADHKCRAETPKPVALQGATVACHHPLEGP